MVENMSDTLEFGASMLTGIDRLAAAADVPLDLRSVDANVAAGETLAVDLSACTTFSAGFNGFMETDGHFDLTSGGAGGFVEGGALADTISMSAHTSIYLVRGNGGADDITCNSGEDRLGYLGVSESTSVNRDVIHAFNADADKFDATVAGTGTVQSTFVTANAATFDSDMGFAFTDGLGTGNNIGVINVASGDLMGRTFVFVNVGGSDKYNGGVDYIFDITGYTGTLDASDFI
jgi:hypothetical protein